LSRADHRSWYGTLAGLLDDQAVEMRHIMERSRGPAVCSIANVCRHTFFTHRLRYKRHQPLLARVMHLRQPYNCQSERGSGWSTR
jgi:hypothetical protein